jgi:peptidoglycan/LPS O-acetylase OafA/YrhL
LPHESEPRRYYELDSLRGLAALTVVFLHFSRICSPRVVHIFNYTPLRLLVAGRAAVILFFLLSGLVLTLPYKKNGRLDYGPFLLKRVCRLYVPYLGAQALARAFEPTKVSPQSPSTTLEPSNWPIQINDAVVAQKTLPHDSGQDRCCNL